MFLFYFPVFILICSFFFYRSKFISICITLYTIHIYFRMRKLYLITFHISKHLCHFDVYPNIATNMLNYMVIMSSGWFLLTQIHRIGNTVLDFSVWCQFLVPIYIRSLPLPSAYIYILGGVEFTNIWQLKLLEFIKLIYTYKHIIHCY